MSQNRALSGRGGRAFFFWIVVALSVLVDQATKAAVRATLKVGEAAPFIEGVIELRHVQNTGAAFSLGEGAGPLFVLIAVAVLGAAFYLVLNEDMPWWLVLPISCVAGGGVGNMIDRLITGYVTDFLCTTFITFPVFNVADILVTCGVVIGLVHYWVWDTRREAEASRLAAEDEEPLEGEKDVA